ncbi:hypothetical protein Tco_1492393 [Tanacetum coccineum]
MVLNSPCFTVKSWLVQDQTVPVQKQTAFGKDKSNPLIVDSLLKTIRFSIHLVVYNEKLAIPEQTATGKGTSNPLMAVCVELSILATTLKQARKIYIELGSIYFEDETHVAGSMVESSRIKKEKKFDFVTEDGKHIHLIEEQINQQKKIEE